MSRRSSRDDGSLDLLLDTICNTFGGVLFISILVVLLLNMSSKEAADTPPSETVQAELIEAEVRLSQTNDELQRLMTAIKTQGQIADQIVNPELSGLVRTMTSVQQGIAERAEEKVRGIEEVTQNQIEINEKTQQIAVHEELLRNAQGSLAGIQRRLEEEIEARTQAAKLPKGRETRKQQMPMFLKQGRLCTHVKRANNRLIRNDDETVIKQDDQNKQFIEPKPGTGVVIHPDGDNAGLVARLDHFRPDEHYLAVFVWPDSFPHFSILKDLMVAREFEYLLVPFEGDQKIYIGAQEQPIQVQ